MIFLLLSLTYFTQYDNVCCCSVAQLCPTLCDPIDCSAPGLLVPHHLPKFAQVHVHSICDAIQPSFPLMPSSPALDLSQHQRMDAFKLRCWIRLFKVPWAARRSKQLILREINPDYSLEGRMLKLKLQYFGHLMRTDDSLEKSLMLGKIEGKRRRGHQRMRWLDGITDAMT